MDKCNRRYVVLACISSSFCLHMYMVVRVGASLSLLLQASC